MGQTMFISNNQLIDEEIKEEEKEHHHKGHKKRPHKGSWDSSSLSSHSSNNGGPISNNLLKRKAEEVKAHNPFNSGAYCMSGQGNASKNVKKYDSSIGLKTKTTNKLVSHKDSKDSGAVGTEQLGESIVPPQVIDNSAVLFSNTKTKKGKFKRPAFQNPLQSDIDKSEWDYQSVIDDSKQNKSYPGLEGEGEYDGEGESYSSSCSCSSCLRERNADNGVSLKLSQYSYRPTYAGFQKHDTENESQAINMSKMQDDVDTSYYNDHNLDQSANVLNENSKLDPSIAEFSNT